MEVKIKKNITGVNVSYIPFNETKVQEESLLTLTNMKISEIKDLFNLLSSEEQFVLTKKYSSSLIFVNPYDKRINDHKVKCECAIKKLINLKNKEIIVNVVEKEKVEKDVKPVILNKSKSNVERNGLIALTNLSIEEIRKRVSFATNKQQSAMKIRFGENLDEVHPYPKDNNKTSMTVLNCLKFITTEPFIYEKKKVNRLNIEKYGLKAITGLSLETLQERIKFAPIEWQVAIKKRYGDNLDELHSYSNNEYLVKCCLKFITTKPFTYKMLKGEKEDVTKYGLVARTGLDLTELQKRVSFLTIDEQKIMKQRFGKNLDELYSYIEDDNNIRAIISHCIKYITSKDFVYKPKSSKYEDINKYGLLVRINKNREKELTIEEIRKRLELATTNEKMAMKKRFGESLLELYEYPKDNETLRVLVNNCIKFITKEPFIYEKINKFDDVNLYGLLANINKNRTNKLTIEEVRIRVNYATIEEQEAMKLRYGPNLDEVHPYSKDGYYKIYNNVSKCLKFITKEPFIYETKEKDKTISELEFITGLTMEEIKFRVSLAPLDLQEAMKLRYGPNLDAVYPYPKEEYYQVYNKVSKCTKFITAKPFISDYKSIEYEKKQNDINNHKLLTKVNKDRENKLTIEEIRKRVSLATESQQKAMKLRFGEDLLELNPYPKNDQSSRSIVSSCLKFITTEPFFYSNDKHILNDLKYKLINQKLINYKITLINKYYNLYYNLIDIEDIKNIVNEVLDNELNNYIEIEIESKIFNLLNEYKRKIK